MKTFVLMKQNEFRNYANVRVDVDMEKMEIIVLGLPHERGVFQREFSKKYDEFQQKTKVIKLNTQQNKLFQEGKAGLQKLYNIDEDFGQDYGGIIEHDRVGQNILIYNPQGIEQSKDYIQDVQELISDLYQEDFDIKDLEKCVFCQKDSCIETLSYCGHKFCIKGLENYIKDAMQNNRDLNLKCKDQQCQKPILFLDLQNFDQEFLDQIRNYIIIRKIKNGTNFVNDRNQKLKFNDCCGSIQVETPYPVMCYECCQVYCEKCNSRDIEHSFKTCFEFQQYQQQIQEQFWLGQLIKKGRQFIEENWIGMDDDCKIKPIIISENPFLFQQNQPKSLEMFLEGVEKSKIDKRDGFFAWHGTSNEAILPICQGSWDTNRRRGQFHGPGEYFAITPDTSHGYTGYGGSQILSYIINVKRKIKKVDGFCYVVDNPLYNTYSYCLPLLVIEYQQRVPNLQNLILDITQEVNFSGSAIDKFNEICWRFKWKDDESNYEPYKDIDNLYMEEAYIRWKQGKNSHQVKCHNIVRYNDDQQQDYLIDFIQMTQTNIKTNYVRKIIRERETQQILEFQWQFQDDDNIYKDYEKMIQNKLNEEYKKYCQQENYGCFQIQFPGRPEKYDINFNQMKQTNTKTFVTRDIKKIKVQDYQSQYSNNVNRNRNIYNNNRNRLTRQSRNDRQLQQNQFNMYRMYINDNLFDDSDDSDNSNDNDDNKDYDYDDDSSYDDSSDDGGDISSDDSSDDSDEDNQFQRRNYRNNNYRNDRGDRNDRRGRNDRNNTDNINRRDTRDNRNIRNNRRNNVDDQDNRDNRNNRNTRNNRRSNLDDQDNRDNRRSNRGIINIRRNDRNNDNRRNG